MKRLAIISLLALGLMSGCKPISEQEVAKAEPAAPDTSSAVTTEVPEELAGTVWQLVKIMSMDDSVDQPDEPGRYTLEFREDGSAAVLADCNHGTGSWTSETAGKLEFGPMATTRAMCPPGSLSDKYLAQLGWVRSYVMEEGNLFLATMADGSILEFSPVHDVAPAATVLGAPIRTNDAGELQQAVISALFDQYAQENGLEASAQETESYIDKLQQAMAADENMGAEDDLTPEEVMEVREMRENMARSLISQWKINRQLHQQYGGRIIYQQLGPEPLDAYRQFFQEREQAGDFKIHNPDMAEEFWRYFTDETMHDFMEAGGEDERKAYSTPPWE